MLYFDTSALIKKYVDEPRSNEVRELLAEPQIVATCVISRAEAAAALSRAVRVGSLAKSDAEALPQELCPRVEESCAHSDS